MEGLDATAPENPIVTYNRLASPDIIHLGAVHTIVGRIKVGGKIPGRLSIGVEVRTCTFTTKTDSLTWIWNEGALRFSFFLHLLRSFLSFFITSFSGSCMRLSALDLSLLFFAMSIP
jgi:hypothetical protein